MKRLLLIIIIPLILGPAGYFAGMFLTEKPPQETPVETGELAPQRLLFKMPLGALTTQIMQSKRIIHIVLDVDVYLAGAGEFAKLNGATGRSMLRDATITALSDLAETTLWATDGVENPITNEELASQITLKLLRNFTSVRGARVNELVIAITKRI